MNRADFAPLRTPGLQAEDLDWNDLDQAAQQQLQAAGYAPPVRIDGLMLGNNDLVCEYVPTHIEPGVAPLSVYPQWSDLPQALA